MSHTQKVNSFKKEVIKGRPQRLKIIWTEKDQRLG